MTPNILFKIASVIILLHGLGHTTGIYTWQNEKSAVPKPLIKQMQESNFIFAKTQANMAAFYTGMGYAATIALLLVSFLLWICPNLTGTSATYVQYGLIAFLLALGVLELKYFFPMAASFSFLAAILSIVAQFMSQKS